jgi:hypothetical protein
MIDGYNNIPDVLSSKRISNLLFIEINRRRPIHPGLPRSQSDALLICLINCDIKLNNYLYPLFPDSGGIL